MVSLPLARLSHCFLVGFVFGFVGSASPSQAWGQLEIFGIGNRESATKAIKESRQRLAEEFPLRVKDGVLGFEFTGDFSTASASVNRIASGRGGSSSHGGDNFSCRSSGEFVMAQISSSSGNRGLGPESEPRDLVSIKGAGSDIWSTQFVNSPDYFFCSHLDLGAKVLLHLISSKSETRLILFDGPEMIEFQGRNYFELVSQPGFQPVVDRMEVWGIRLPSQIGSTEFSELMLGMFRVSPEDWKDFENDFKDLTSSSYQERETATQQLKSELSQWKHLIVWGLMNEEVSVELKSRLLAVIKDDAEDETAQQINALISGKLLDNPSSLLELLTKSEPVEDQVATAIIDRLQRLTDQAFGSDLVAWKKWIAENSHSQPVPLTDQAAPENQADRKIELNPEPELKDENLVDRVSIELIREELSQLLTLTIDQEDRIRIDHQRWKDHFGAVDIPALLTETQAQFEKSGLPKSWLNLGAGYDLSTIDYPQLLFAKIEDRLNQQIQSMGQVGMMLFSNRQPRPFQENQPTKSFNRELQVGEIKLDLQMHRSEPRVQPQKMPEQQFFDFRIEDRQRNLLMAISDHPKGDFALMIYCVEAKEYVFVCQDSAQAWIHVSSSRGSFTASAASPQALFTQHADQWKQLLHPILRDHGVDLNKSTGGSLEIKNAVLKMENKRGGRR